MQRIRPKTTQNLGWPKNLVSYKKKRVEELNYESSYHFSRNFVCVLSLYILARFAFFGVMNLADQAIKVIKIVG